MVLFTWKPLFPLLLLSLLLFYEDWVSIPSCDLIAPIPSPLYNEEEHPNNNPTEDLKVMLVANLLLLGSDSDFFNLYFRDYYLSKFFKKSFQRLKPDMLLVLGDVSAKGYDLTRSKWASVVDQFHGILGPFIELPFHVVLGDRDVGECSGLDANSVYWLGRSFPGLDSSGCGAFEISNVSFVSLNAVALLCGNNKLRFSVEKVIESERLAMDGSGKFPDMSNGDIFRWRENARSRSSGSGPVLLLHFPLHSTAKDNCKKARDSLLQGSNTIKSRGFFSTGPYELLHSVPPNATEYIFQALKPRIIFSAHSHELCYHIHSDGTREVTVPAMTWKVRDDPGFILATFQSDRNDISVSYCSLARESHVLVAYILLLVLLLTICLMTNMPHLRCLRQ